MEKHGKFSSEEEKKVAHEVSQQTDQEKLQKVQEKIKEKLRELEKIRGYGRPDRLLRELDNLSFLRRNYETLIENAKSEEQKEEERRKKEAVIRCGTGIDDKDIFAQRGKTNEETKRNIELVLDKAREEFRLFSEAVREAKDLHLEGDFLYDGKKKLGVLPMTYGEISDPVMKVLAEDIWLKFLASIPSDSNPKLEVGHCPRCGILKSGSNHGSYCSYSGVRRWQALHPSWRYEIGGNYYPADGDGLFGGLDIAEGYFYKEAGGRYKYNPVRNVYISENGKEEKGYLELIGDG